MLGIYVCECEFKDGKPILRKPETSTRGILSQIPEGYYLVQQHYPIQKEEKVELAKHTFDQPVTAP